MRSWIVVPDLPAANRTRSVRMPSWARPATVNDAMALASIITAKNTRLILSLQQTGFHGACRTRTPSATMSTSENLPPGIPGGKFLSELRIDRDPAPQGVT